MEALQLDGQLKKTFRYFLYIFAAAMPFSIFITQVAIGVLLLCWLSRILITKQLKFKKIGLEYAFLAYLLASLISLPFSTNFWQSVEFLKRFLLIPIVYFLATGIEDEKDFKNTIIIFIVSIGLYSLSGIISFIIDPALRVRHVQNSMTAGGITMLGVLAGFAVAWFSKKKSLKIGLFLITVVICLCLALTVTRGSWVGFFAGILLIIYYLNKKLLLLIPIVVVVFYFLIPELYKDRIDNIFNPEYRTNRFRLDFWQIGFEIFKDHPIVGIGDVNTGDVYDMYNYFSEEQSVGHFHNNFVHIAVTLGSIGLAAFLYMTLAIFYRLIKLLRTKNYGWTLAALAMFLAFHINGLFEWNYGDQEIITMIWFVVGMAIFIDAKVQEKVQQHI